MYVYPIILHVVTKFLSRKQSDLYGSAIKRGDSSFEQQSIVETFSIQGNEMCPEVHKILFIKGTT